MHEREKNQVQQQNNLGVKYHFKNVILIKCMQPRATFLQLYAPKVMHLVESITVMSRGTVLQQRYGMSVDLNCMEKLLRCLMLCQI